MRTIFTKIKSCIIYLVGTFLVMSIFVWWKIFAANDLLRQMFEPSYYQETVIGIWENVNTVWREFFDWSFDAEFKIKRVVKTDDNGNPICKGGECPDNCKEYNPALKDECKWQYKLDNQSRAGKQPSLIVQATKILLLLVVALSVTMILYNGLIYIVQTWQGKEGKSLVKNVVYIVIWIILSLFSVTIITILQSVSKTLDDETVVDLTQEIDGDLLNQ